MVTWLDTGFWLVVGQFVLSGFIITHHILGPNHLTYIYIQIIITSLNLQYVCRCMYILLFILKTVLKMCLAFKAVLSSSKSKQCYNMEISSSHVFVSSSPPLVSHTKHQVTDWYILWSFNQPRPSTQQPLNMNDMIEENKSKMAYSCNIPIMGRTKPTDSQWDIWKDS